MTQHLKAIYEICEGLSLAYLVLGAFTLCFLMLSLLNYFLLHSDKLTFLLRWLRFFLELSYIYMILKLAFELNGYYSIILLSGLIAIWAEFTYIWFKAISYSNKNIVPFSNMLECDNAWRQGLKYYKLKQRIEAEGFKKLKSFKATGRISLATLFYNKKDNIALLVVFRLYKSRLRTIYFLLSKTEEGNYLVFTNDFSEDILFLKGNYGIHYRLFSSFKSLLKKQKSRMKYGLDNFINFEQDSENLPYTIYNDNLNMALSANIYSKNRQEGQLLSAEGKFQFCKKLIIKNYFRI